MPDRMTEQDIENHVGHAIEQAFLYSRDESAEDNARAIAFFNGDVSSQIENEEGRSQAVSRDVADTITWMMPQMMRVFRMSDKLAEYLPRRPDDVDAARQANMYCNYVVTEECDGYQVLNDAIFDAFLLRFGVVKCWWDTSEEYDIARYSRLSQDQFVAIAQDDDVEVLEYSEADPETTQAVDPQTGQPVAQEAPRFDIKIKRLKSRGRLRMMVVPPERFLRDREATCVRDALGAGDARIVGDYEYVTRSELLEEGWDRDKVAQIPAHSAIIDEREDDARREGLSTYEIDTFEALNEKVVRVEAYTQVDRDGDGVLEWVRVVMGGIGGGAVMLHIEEWDDDHPYYPAIPDRVPHRFEGRSIAEQTMDIQAQKTVAKRGMLDNLYLTNNPTPIYDETAVRSNEAVEGLTVLDGSPVGVNGDPNRTLAWSQVPYIADKCLQVMEYLDQEREMRTGMSRVAMGLSQDVLNNQTATATQLANSASLAKVEQYARNLAEGFVKPLMKGVYRLITQNQDRPRIIRLQGSFVEVDPRPWTAEMDVEVNVGLGTGSRDRDAIALEKLGLYAQNVIQTYGPDNPLVGLQQVRELGVMMAETQGLKGWERIIGGGNGEIEQWMQQQAEAAQQPPPEVQKEQMKMQLEQQKMQAEQQMDREKAQQDAQIETAKMQQQGELERQRMEQDIVLMREKTAGEMQAKRYQVDQEMELKRYQIQEELSLKRQVAQHDAQVKAEQVRVGGKPG